MATFYDNEASYLPAAGAAVPVERVYCLRFSEFTPEHWKLLQRTYEQLPGWSGIGEHGCPCWFGLATSPPFLVASVEPSGLQVSGSVSERDWNRWHEAFFASLVELPTFEV